jgi:hypothetical protein
MFLIIKKHTLIKTGALMAASISGLVPILLLPTIAIQTADLDKRVETCEQQITAIRVEIQTLRDEIQTHNHTMKVHQQAIIERLEAMKGPGQTAPGWFSGFFWKQ